MQAFGADGWSGWARGVARVPVLYLRIGVGVYPQLKLHYVHDFESDNPVVFSNLPGLSPTVFAISGVRPGRDFAVAGASLAAHVNDRWDGYVAYNGQFSSEQTVHAGEGGFRFHF
jgi:outer membrane autotransporter protein